MTWNADGKVICEVCGKRPAVAVLATSVPYSAAYCRECAEAGVDPYWILVANTACIDGLEHAGDWWREMVARSLEYLGKTREEFDADVAADIKRLNEYEPPPN